MTVELPEIQQLVAVQLGRRSVGEDDRFIEDLGAESLDVVNVIAAVEDRWGVSIRESDVPDLLTPAALHAYVARRAGG